MSTITISRLTSAQIRALSRDEIQSLFLSDFSSRDASGNIVWNELTSTQIGYLTRGHVRWMTISNVRTINGSGRTVLSDLTTEQVQWLGTATVKSLKPSDLAITDSNGAALLTVLTDSQLRHLSMDTVHQLDRTVVQQFNAHHFQVILGDGKSLLRELTGEQIKHLTLAQLRMTHTDGTTIASQLVAAGKELGVSLGEVLGVSLVEDSGVSTSDGITRVDEVRVTGLVAGRKWQYSLDGGTRWFDGTGTSFDLQATNSKNLLVNPDFTQGCTGFSTDYRLQAQASGAGTLAVVASPPSAWRMGISSGLGGKGDAFLMVDGSSRSDQAFWKQSVELKAGSDCEFSFHAGNGIGPSPKLQLYVNGVATGEVQTLPFRSGWTRYSIKFTAPASGPVELALKNLETTRVGNDFGIDGMSLVSDTDPVNQSFEANTVLVRQTLASGHVIRGGNTDNWLLDTSHPEPTLTFVELSSQPTSTQVVVGNIETAIRWEYSTDRGESWQAGHDGAFVLASGSYEVGNIQVRSSDAAGNQAVASNSHAVKTPDVIYNERLNSLSRADVIDLGIEGLVKLDLGDLRGFVISKLESSLVKSAAMADLQPQHGAILKVFQRITADLAASGKTLSEEEFTDLQLLTNYIGAQNGGWTHIYNACNSLVNGDDYNTWWMNGRPGTEHPDALGNLGPGSTATQLERLTATWLLGQNNPRSGIYSGIEQFTRDVINPADPSLPLFGASGMPEINDITQKYYGDCYLMATIGGLVYTAPGYVKSLFTDYGNGIYGVRFADQFYTMDTSFSSFASVQAGKPIWAALFEKAYTQWRIEGGVGTNYMGIAWGASVDTVPANLLGPENVYRSLRGYEAANKAIDALANGGSAFLASDFDLPGLNSPHAYTVLDYDAASGMFTLRNPWGYQDGGWGEGYIKVGYHSIGSGNARVVSTRRPVEDILLDRQPVAELLYRPVLDIVDTGVSADDGITRDASIGVRLVEPGTNLMLRIDGGEWTPVGRSTFDNNTVAALEGRHTYELMATDGNGRSSPISAPITFTLDTQAPEGHTVALTRSGDNSATVRVDGMEPGNRWEYTSDHGRHWQTGGMADGEGTGTFSLAAPTHAQPFVFNGDFEDGMSGWRSDYGNLRLVTGADGGTDQAIGFYDYTLRDMSGNLDICRTTIDLAEAGDYRLSFDFNVATRIHSWYPFDFIGVAAFVNGQRLGSSFYPSDGEGWHKLTDTLYGLSAGTHTLSLRVVSTSGVPYGVGLTLAVDNLELINANGALSYGKGEVQVRQTDLAGNFVTVANSSALDWNHLTPNFAVLAV